MAIGVLAAGAGGAALGLGAGIGGAVSNVFLAPFNAANNFLGSAYFGYGMIIGERYAYQEDWPKIQKRLQEGAEITSIMHEYAGRFTAMVMGEAKIIFESVTVGFLQYIESKMGSQEIAQHQINSQQYSPDQRVSPPVNTGGNAGWTGQGTPAFLAGAVTTAKTLLPDEIKDQYSNKGLSYEGPGGGLYTDTNPAYQGELARRANLRQVDPPEPLPKPSDARTRKRVVDLQRSIDMEVAAISKAKKHLANLPQFGVSKTWLKSNNETQNLRAKKILKYTNELDNITKGEIFTNYNPLYARTSGPISTVTLKNKAPAATYYDPITKTQKIASRGPYYYNN